MISTRSQTRTTILILLLAMALASLAAADDTATGPAASDRDDLATLVDWLTGTFTSTAQAAADTAYFDIHLHMVRVWPERTDAHWLYIEQAVGTMIERPYRQRVYRVVQLGDNLFESAVYTLPDPEAVVGAWRDETPLSGLSPEDLTRREGCGVLLRRDERTGEFFGGTVGRSCGSALGDAAYATSEIRLGADVLESWDRGFTADGEQAWGAVDGAYVFLRQ